MCWLDGEQELKRALDFGYQIFVGVLLADPCLLDAVLQVRFAVSCLTVSVSIGYFRVFMTIICFVFGPQNPTITNTIETRPSAPIEAESPPSNNVQMHILRDFSVSYVLVE
jgi:hypothetical protein